MYKKNQYRWAFFILDFFPTTKKSYNNCQSDNGFWLFRLLSRGWGKEYCRKKNSKKGEGWGRGRSPPTPLPYLPLYSKLIPVVTGSELCYLFMLRAWTDCETRDCNNRLFILRKKYRITDRWDRFWRENTTTCTHKVRAVNREKY